MEKKPYGSAGTEFRSLTVPQLTETKRKQYTAPKEVLKMPIVEMRGSLCLILSSEAAQPWKGAWSCQAGRCFEVA